MYTPSKIKISMLCALALCGQVRRDDLAIFARTADAGVRTIRELEDKGLIEDKTVEVTVRIDGRNRPRMRHVCGLTNAGLLFLLTHGASLFPWLASVPKEIVGRVNLKGGSCTRRIPLDRRLDLSGANCFFIAAGYETRPLVFDENMKEGKPSLASCLAEILPPLDARNDRSFYNVLEIKRDILGNGMAARFARYVGFVVHGGMPAAVYVVPQGGLSWGTSVVNKERALFDDFVLRGMHTAKDNFSMHRLTQGFLRLECLPDKRNGDLIIQCPQKFFKVQGEHLQMFLLRWDDNVLDVLLEPDERACFQIIVATIRHKVFDELPCAGELLHLIKHDEGLPVIELDPEENGQLGEKHIEVGAVIFKDIQYILRDIPKINNDVAFILVFCELLGNEALANAPCAVNQQSCRSAASLLPRNEVVINLPLQHTDSSCLSKSCCFP